MRDAYRRYVPSSVADRLARGEDLVGGERELSILFADVRGYTSYSEGRQAGDVFSVVNVLTEAVSEQIRRHGGTVVEFLGDGVMAVFGAPRTLPDHASAAVAASRAIVEVIGRLRIGGAASQRPLAVGVGIATGPAFVGNVETKERLIYTAIGDTVNLASRLQALTRELGAVVAIDHSTLAAAGVTADGFESRGAIEIRGRRERAEVFILPLGETVDSSRPRRDGDGSS
jgi:adenylate cyclase